MDLIRSRHNAETTGKVIPELKFVFWQKMFTGRYDDRIWNQHLRHVMPGLNSAVSVADARRDELGADVSLRELFFIHIAYPCINAFTRRKARSAQSVTQPLSDGESDCAFC